ncbi:MAG: ComF family protein [Zoogloeaceae bacterium]|nr:ComF family protein [Zoogloeaceae bacterium]
MNDRPGWGGLSNVVWRARVPTLSWLLDVLLPRHCLVCGVGSGGESLCRACRAELPWQDPGACPRCGLPGDGRGLLCGTCQRHPPAFDSTLAAFRYQFPVDRLIQGVKYGQRLDALAFLAESLGMTIPRHGGEVDLIVPMPLHPRRLADRGFNQAAEVARRVSRCTGIPWAADALVRDRDTPPQVALPWRARLANVRGAFRCTHDLTGRRVALVDDVMTTGASLHEAARAVKSRGAKSVCSWVVARTP